MVELADLEREKAQTRNRIERLAQLRQPDSDSPEFMEQHDLRYDGGGNPCRVAAALDSLKRPSRVCAELARGAASRNTQACVSTTYLRGTTAATSQLTPKQASHLDQLLVTRNARTFVSAEQPSAGLGFDHLVT